MLHHSTLENDEKVLPPIFWAGGWLGVPRCCVAFFLAPWRDARCEIDNGGGVFVDGRQAAANLSTAVSQSVSQSFIQPTASLRLPPSYVHTYTGYRIT
jgi:hypothetical protein